MLAGGLELAKTGMARDVNNNSVWSGMHRKTGCVGGSDVQLTIIRASKRRKIQHHVRVPPVLVRTHKVRLIIWPRAYCNCQILAAGADTTGGGCEVPSCQDVQSSPERSLPRTDLSSATFGTWGGTEDRLFPADELTLAANPADGLAFCLGPHTGVVMSLTIPVDSSLSPATFIRSCLPSHTRTLRTRG